MKLLILDSPYSPYLHDLCKEIENFSSFECFKIDNTFSDYLYTNSMKRWRDEKKIDKLLFEEILNNSDFLRKSDLMADKNFSNSAIKYLNKIHAFHVQNKQFTAIIYNDKRWNHSIAKEYFKKFSIQYFVIERGLERGKTSTFSLDGLHSESWFYENYGEISKDPVIVDRPDFRGVKAQSSEAKATASISLFVLSLLIRKFEHLLIGKHVFHNDHNFIHYVHLAVRRALRFRRKPIDIPDSFILFVGQLSNDAQLRVFSQYKSSIDAFQSYINAAKTSENLIYAVHPNDSVGVEKKIQKLYPNVIVVRGVDQRLIKNASCVVSINSTVCYDALVLGKKTVFLGESVLVNHPDAVTFAKESRATNKRNTISAEMFMKLLTSYYQMPGDLHEYTDKEIKWTAISLLSRLR